MLQLFTRFRIIYHISYIFTLEQRELFRNIVTRFSQIHFFRIFWRLRNIFPDHHSMDFTNFFFVRKIKHFSRNCRNRFLKYVFDVEIYENLRKSSRQFSWFSDWNGHYIWTKTNFKNLFLQFLDKTFFFILTQSSTFSVLPFIGKMFRAKSPVFMSKLSITF